MTVFATSQFIAVNAKQQVTIPAGIFLVTGYAWGAGGGGGGLTNGGSGSSGDLVVFSVAVQPGDVLDIAVGAGGVSGTSVTGTDSDGNTTGGAGGSGGFARTGYGGGSGGSGGSRHGNGGGGGGGGGGATTIAYIPINGSPTGNVVAIAGGGGGGGGGSKNPGSSAFNSNSSGPTTDHRGADGQSGDYFYAGGGGGGGGGYAGGGGGAHGESDAGSTGNGGVPGEGGSSWYDPVRTTQLNKAGIFHGGGPLVTPAHSINSAGTIYSVSDNGNGYSFGGGPASNGGDGVVLLEFYTQPNPWVKVNGVWKKVTTAFVKAGAAWKTVAQVWIKQNGEWLRVNSGQSTFTTTTLASGVDYGTSSRGYGS